MKKRNILWLFPLALLFSGTPAKQATKTFDGKFYDSTQKLDLTDSTEAEINDYYGDIGNKTGDELMSYLYTRISCPTEDLSKYYLEYGSGVSKSNVGGWYQITDRNWSISDPVNPEDFKFKTKKTDEGISGIYLYNMYISDEANNDKTKAFNNFANGTGWTTGSQYTSIDYANTTKNNTNIQVDKEHVWAKNHGFKVKGSKGDTFVPGAPTDLHHLVAADHNTNSAGHNDHFYGVVAKHDMTTEIKNYLANGESEISGWLDTKTDTFEPTDEWKGDIARCLLYMGTRYSYKKDVNTQAEPYLYLTDDTSYKDDDAQVADSEKKFHGVQYNLSELLSWNELDPVSDYEIHRNNLIYKNVQNNRNPFIDHPEWARRVYDVNYKADSRFDELRASYDTYTKNEYTLDVTIADTSKIAVSYDKTIINLHGDLKTITPLKEGITELVYTYTTDAGEENYKTTINVKELPALATVAPTFKENYNLDLKATGEIELHIPNNLYGGETIKLVSSNENIVAIDGNKMIGKGLGTATVSINITGEKRSVTLANFEVTVKPSKKKIYIAIIIVASALLILIFVFLAVTIHTQNTKPNVNYSSKKTYNKAVKKSRGSKKSSTGTKKGNK